MYVSLGCCEVKWPRNMKLTSGVGRGDIKVKEKQDRKEKLCKKRKKRKRTLDR